MHLFSYFDVRAEFSWQWESCSWCLLLRLMAAALSGDIAWANRTLVQGLFAFVISYLLSTSINRVLLKSTFPVWSNFWLVPGSLQWAASLLELAMSSSSAGTSAGPHSGESLTPLPPVQAPRESPSPGSVTYGNHFSVLKCVCFFYLFWQCALGWRLAPISTSLRTNAGKWKPRLHQVAFPSAPSSSYPLLHLQNQAGHRALQVLFC